MFKVVCDKRVSESMESLDQQDMEYLLKLNEYLDVLDYISEVHMKDSEKQSKVPPIRQMR